MTAIVTARTARQEDEEAITWASKIFGPGHPALTNMQSQSYIHLPDIASCPAASKEHVVGSQLFRTASEICFALESALRSASQYYNPKGASLL